MVVAVEQVEDKQHRLVEVPAAAVEEQVREQVLRLRPEQLVGQQCWPAALSIQIFQMLAARVAEQVEKGEQTR